MRIFLFIFFVFVCLSSSFWGCQKEDLGNLDSIFTDTAQTGPIAEMIAKVNDTDWNATVTDATVVPGQLTLTGMSDDGQRISLNVFSSTSGDFLLRAASTSSGKYYPDSLAATVAYTTKANTNTGGVINIETLDTVNDVMSGSFNFITARPGSTNLKTITDGIFKNISFTNTDSKLPFSVKKGARKWPAAATATVNGSTLTITATDPSNDTTISISMPVAVVASSKAIPIEPSGLYTASAQEKTAKGAIINLTVDTSAATKTKYKFSPSLTILSNNGSIIQGTFQVAVKYAVGKINIITAFTAGSFYLKYK